MGAVNGMKNLESRSRRPDVTRNAFKKLKGLNLPSLLQKGCRHMNLKDATIHSTQAHIDTTITEQWVSFHLDHPEDKDFVTRTTGMWYFCSYTAQGLAHRTAIFVTSAQLSTQKFDKKLQRWARCN